MKDTVILATKFGMGQTDNVGLNMNLITKYFSLLLEGNECPSVVCFYTDGVWLATKNSPILEQLSQLEQKGTRLIICSTCLDKMGLKENDVKVGVVGGMTDIIEAQTRAAKVITI